MKASCAFAVLLCLTCAHAADNPAAQPPEPGLQVPERPVKEVPAGVDFRGDVTFLPSDRTEKLDLYIPKGRPQGTRSPAVVVIHGGGWKTGNKSARREIDSGSTLALAGYVCASVEYDKAPGNWPRNLLDCKNAVRFLRSHQGDFGVDSDHIGVIGGSAGGHLALMVAFTPQVMELEPHSSYPAVRDDVQACINMYGPCDLAAQQKTDDAGIRSGKGALEMFPANVADPVAMWHLASPLHHIHKGCPPVLTFHGAKDEIVNPSQALTLDAELREAGVEHQTVILPDSAHTFTLHSVKEIDIAALAVAFFDKHLKPAHP